MNTDDPSNTPRRTPTAKRGGFEPIPQSERPCIDPSHGFPTHLYIPPGQQYRHICPSCGAEQVVRAAQISWSVPEAKATDPLANCCCDYTNHCPVHGSRRSSADDKHSYINQP